MNIKPDNNCFITLLNILVLVFTLLISACDRQKEPASEATGSTAKTAGRDGGRQLAEQDCVKCHPPSGDIVKRDYPQINGQHAEYLKSALLAYHTGKRINDTMRKILLKYDVNDIDALANYYSSLDTPWRQVLIPAKQPASGPDPKAIEAGKKLAQPCLSCHGETGNSPTPGVPSVAGLSQQYVANALQDYFHGRRKNDIMEVFKYAFDNKSKVDKLGAYFASLKRQRTELPGTGNAAAGAKLAKQHCIGCHGEQGNSYIDRFPTLAGQNSQYLYQATLSYREGSRHNELMKNAIKNLTRQDITNLAAYYAKQEPVAMEQPGTSNARDPMKIAETTAAACYGCHGKDGNSNMNGTPDLSGLKPPYLVNAITQYINGERKHALMKSFVADLSKPEMDLIAAHFAAQEPAITSNTGNGSADKARELVSGCEGCHGEHGNSQSEVPSIAGQDADYLVQALLAYQDKQRSSSDMQSAVEGLSKSDFQNLATYFAQQQPVKPDVQPLQNAEQLAHKCNRCHEVQEPGVEQIAPRIAGQSEPYLRDALYEYKNKTREQSTMFAMLDVLTDWEIRDLARYYARLNSRSK
ncbi:MAG: c-type cytochrome [Gammaproteobacteria bacterium]|jgi:cytochrome c553